VTDRPLKLFTGNANRQLAAAIAEHLGIPLGDMTVGRFSDGEIRVQINENVRGVDAFIIQPTCTPVNETLMELLVIMDAARRASAARIVPVVPYYGYARQDKKMRPREPITAKLVADLMMAAGAQRLLCIDLHAQPIQGFFNVPVDHLMAAPILTDDLAARGLCGDRVAVVSPDVGGVAAARVFANRLNSPLVIISKRRPRPNVAEALEVIGELNVEKAVIVDDMIDTGGTVLQAADALVDRGIREVYACATHGVLSDSAVERLEESPICEVIVTDTVPVREGKKSDKIRVLSVAPLLADAIRRVHEDRSVSELFRS